MKHDIIEDFELTGEFRLANVGEYYTESKDSTKVFQWIEAGIVPHYCSYILNIKTSDIPVGWKSTGEFRQPDPDEYFILSGEIIQYNKGDPRVFVRLVKAKNITFIFDRISHKINKGEYWLFEERERKLIYANFDYELTKQFPIYKTQIDDSI